MLVEREWARLVTRKSSLPLIVWEGDWSEHVWEVLASLVAGDLSSEQCQQALSDCFECEADIPAEEGIRALRLHGRMSDEATVMRRELQLWPKGWLHAKVIVSSFDFNNDFGWHALPTDDIAWTDEYFRDAWAALARGGCRGHGTNHRVGSGVLPKTTFSLSQAVEALLPSDYDIISLAGSGTEAVQSFYTVANAFLSVRRGVPVTDAKLLFFRGGYVGGAHMLQGANCITFIKDRALAPTSVTAELLIDNGPFSREALAEFEALLTIQQAGSACNEIGSGECTDDELQCL